MTFSMSTAKHVFGCFADIVHDNREFLCGLDSQAGDGDHGMNLDRGLNRVFSKMGEREYEDLGALFRDVAINLMDSVGGFSGPLYGVFFMKMADMLAGKQSVEFGELSSTLRASLDNLKKLGNADVGDKTMIDALEPAVAALEASDGADASATWAEAVKAAETGANSTDGMAATRGKAGRDPEASRAGCDPGAMSAYYLITSFQQACSI